MWEFDDEQTAERGVLPLVIQGAGEAAEAIMLSLDCDVHVVDERT